MHKIRLASMSSCRVFFDFDNTIAPLDVLDDIIKKFSVDRKWAVLEKDWLDGKIGSRECLEGQLKSVRVTKNELSRYIAKIKIDPYFYKFCLLLKDEGLRLIILSDSFSFIIKSVLSNNGIKDAQVFANRLGFKGDRLIPSFPFTHKRCKRCAHCKKNNLLKKGTKNKIIIYVGDGLSDICPAENSDMVFAKGRLLEHFRKKKRLCVAFRNLKQIYNYFQGLKNGTQAKN